MTETQIVTEQVEVYKPLPETLTRPLEYPQVELSGELPVETLLDMIFEFYGIVDVANADREKAAELTRPLLSSDTPP